MGKEVELTIIGLICGCIAIILAHVLPTYWDNDADKYIEESLPIIWDFSDGLDTWERTGTALPWETLNDSVEWHQSWGSGVGVVVMDSCYRPLRYPPVKSSCGILKTVHLPSTTTKLIANILKISEDGAVIFKIVDLHGETTLGTEYLTGGQTKNVLYNITMWAGEDVTIKIMSFGWGEGATENCPEENNACCGEYIGLDKVEIT